MSHMFDKLDTLPKKCRCKCSHFLQQKKIKHRMSILFGRKVCWITKALEVRFELFEFLIFGVYLGVSKNRGTPKTPQNDHF